MGVFALGPGDEISGKLRKLSLFGWVENGLTLHNEVLLSRHVLSLFLGLIYKQTVRGRAGNGF